jgi:hypothetical protein
MTRYHTHDCARCHAPVECSDDNLERNYDGFPEVICTAYHLSDGSLAHLLCDDCEDLVCPVCRTNDRHGYRRCADCEDGDVEGYDSGRHDPTHPANREAWSMKR